MFHYAVDMPFGMAVHEGQASAMINGMEIRVHGKSSHWCQASQGIDSIYAASLVVQALHDLNETYQGKGPCLVGIGTFHGGEYSNIITDLVTLRGNIRAAYEEDYQALDEKMQAVLQEIEKRTGTRIEIEYPKPAVLPFANDASLTRIAAAAGKKVFGEHFILEDENQLFLSGDNAYRYFQKSRGLFSVFLAGIPGKTYPLHHPKFQIDEAVLPYSLEALYESCGNFQGRRELIRQRETNGVGSCGSTLWRVLPKSFQQSARPVLRYMKMQISQYRDKKSLCMYSSMIHAPGFLIILL